MIKIYIDDIRTPNDGGNWKIARSILEFQNILDIFPLSEIECISFDHDLGESIDGTLNPDGYDCAKTLVNYAIEKQQIDNFPITFVHSSNVVGAENIIKYINCFLRFHEKHETCRWKQIPFIV